MGNHRAKFCGANIIEWDLEGLETEPIRRRSKYTGYTQFQKQRGMVDQGRKWRLGLAPGGDGGLDGALFVRAGEWPDAGQQNIVGSRVGLRAGQLRPRVQPVLLVRERGHREDSEERQDVGRAGKHRVGRAVRVQSAPVAAWRRKKD